MKCSKCGNELRIGNEQVGIDNNKNPIIHQFSYCDLCRTKFDLTIQSKNYSTNNVNVNQKKPESVCGIIGMILSFLSCLSIFWVPAIILSIIGLCSKKKKSTCGTIGLIVCIFTILAGILAPQLMKYTEEAKQEKSGKKSVVVSDKKEISQSKDNGNIILVGETVSDDGLKITFNECSLDFTDYEDNYGYYKPNEGNKYVMASFTYQNDSDSDKYVSIYDFNCYSDGTVSEQCYYFGGDFINANISSGRNVSFQVFFEVPINSNEIELEYETKNIWSDEKYIFKLQ